jgi:hypothetical protein
MPQMPQRSAALPNLTSSGFMYFFIAITSSYYVMRVPALLTLAGVSTSWGLAQESSAVTFGCAQFCRLYYTKLSAKKQWPKVQF